mgnify:CR=1 FL=1
MKQFGYILLGLLLFCGITATLAASCRPISSNQCNQECSGTECKCNTTEAPRYNSCNQTCTPQYCNDHINITCIAQQNCIQDCYPGKCNMTCNANDYCKQKADYNGAETMSCSSKQQCVQSCEKGRCNMMHCEADACLQTCGNGGCTMTCTESVKVCSQSCTANTKCTLDCRAKVCLQECSGPMQCIIVNAAPSQVHLHFPQLFIAFFMLLLQ